VNILQISSSDHGGGSERVAQNLLKAYQDRGHTSWLAVGGKKSDNSEILTIPHHKVGGWSGFWWKLDSHLQLWDGQIQGVHIARRIFRGLAEPRRVIEKYRGIEDFNFPGTWRLLEMSLLQPDIIHCHNLHGGYFDLRVLPWLSHKVPVILNLRDAWLLSGHCAHSYDCNRWKTGCGNCPYLHTYPPVKRDATAYNWRRKRDIYQKSWLYVTTPSQWLMDKVRSSMLNGIQYRVIPNAVNSSEFFPGNQLEARMILNLPQSAKIILLAAQNEFKDFDTMEKALAQLDLENQGLLFVCLGRKGENKTVGKGRMIFRGFEKDITRMASYYRASEVYLHAAKEDNFPNAVLEAMACGIPVVATSTGGIPEQIDDGRTGFLIKPKDINSMSAAIKRLLVDSDLRMGMGQQGVAEVQKRYRFERQVDAFLTWYQEILEDWKQF